MIARGARATAPSPRRPRPARASAGPANKDSLIASSIVGVAAFAVYAMLSPHAPGDKDSGEFMLVLATFGVAHPTGYPLYTLVGGGFVHAAHALGASWAWGANLLSALCGGVAMGALHALGARLLRGRAGGRTAIAVALLPVATFLLNPIWTVEATLAEVNAAHVAWVALAAWIALAASTLVTARADDARVGERAAFAWGLVVGAGIAHHLTSVLFAAPLTIALAWTLARGGAARGRAVWAFVGGAILPLTSLAWVAWHAWHPAAVQWPELGASWKAVFDHLTGAQYRSLLGRFAPSVIQAQELSAYGYPWLVLALAGAVGAIVTHSGAPDRAVRVALAVAVLAQTGYAFVYGVSDPSAYFLPAIAIGLVLAMASLAEIPAVRAHGRWLGAVAAVALVFVQVHGAGVAAHRRASLESFDALLRRMWASLPPGPSIVVWDDDMAVRLVALQKLEGSHRDVEVVQPRHLTYVLPRARFVQAHGFDPVAELPTSDPSRAQGDERASAALVEAIVDRINRHTEAPVVLFLPQIPSVRRLQKPVP